MKDANYYFIKYTSSNKGLYFCLYACFAVFLVTLFAHHYSCHEKAKKFLPNNVQLDMHSIWSVDQYTNWTFF